MSKVIRVMDIERMKNPVEERGHLEKEIDNLEEKIEEKEGRLGVIYQKIEKQEVEEEKVEEKKTIKRKTRKAAKPNAE